MKNIKMTIMIVALLVGLSSCTYSINMVHIDGTASNVVDDSDTNSNETGLHFPVF